MQRPECVQSVWNLSPQKPAHADTMSRALRSMHSPNGDPVNGDEESFIVVFLKVSAAAAAATAAAIAASRSGLSLHRQPQRTMQGVHLRFFLSDRRHPHSLGGKRSGRSFLVQPFFLAGFARAVPCVPALRRLECSSLRSRPRSDHIVLCFLSSFWSDGLRTFGPIYGP